MVANVLPHSCDSVLGLHLGSLGKGLLGRWAPKPRKPSDHQSERWGTLGTSEPRQQRSFGRKRSPLNRWREWAKKDFMRGRKQLAGMAGGDCQGSKTSRILGSRPGRLRGGLEKPYVTLRLKDPLHQVFHGPWAKKAWIWSFIPSGLLPSLSDVKGPTPLNSQEQAAYESSRNGRSLLPSPLARSSRVQAAADAPHGLQVCSGEGATGQQWSPRRCREMPKRGGRLPDRLLSDWSSQQLELPSSGWASQGAKCVSVDDERGASRVPEGQWLVPGALGVRAAPGEQQAARRPCERTVGLGEAAEAAEKPGRASRLEHQSLSFQESPFPEARACCYLFIQG